MIRKLLPMAALVAAPLVGFSQDQDIFMIEYPIAFGVGDLGEFIDEPSFRGIGLGYRKVVDEEIAVGLDVGWQTFYEAMDLATYTDGTQSITGKQFRYMNMFTASVQVDKVFSPGSDLRPFVGIGAGTSNARRRVDMGQWSLEKDPWQFMLQPEAGVSLYLTNGNAMMLSANYFWGFKTQQLEAQSFLSLNIGYAFGG
jgi:opacity protein-like surface antigen